MSSLSFIRVIAAICHVEGNVPVEEYLGAYKPQKVRQHHLNKETTKRGFTCGVRRPDLHLVTLKLLLFWSLFPGENPHPPASYVVWLNANVRLLSTPRPQGLQLNDTDVFTGITSSPKGLKTAGHTSRWSTGRHVRVYFYSFTSWLTAMKWQLPVVLKSG